MMMKKFKFLMFIDDDNATNFYHEIIVEESGLCDKYIFFNKAENALTYLKNMTVPNEQVPDIIFLDINMPMIDGWKFLELYAELDIPKSSIIIMLTTSLNPKDQERVEKNELVRNFLNKPLDSDKLQKMITDFYEV